MRRIFWGFCRNWFLIDPLHYLLRRSDFGFEFAEIFVIEKRLPDSASHWLPDSPSRRVGFWMFKRKLGESESQQLPDSASRGVAKGPCRTGLCKKPRKSVSLPCPFKIHQKCFLKVPCGEIKVFIIWRGWVRFVTNLQEKYHRTTGTLPPFLYA